MDSSNGASVLNRVSHALGIWRQTRLPNARRFLDENPEVKSSRNLVIDLAYEEFCLREESGERIDTAAFCRRFPTVQHSLARMLDVHRVLAGKSLGLANHPQLSWPEVGQTWLGWRLIEPLGRGTFSRVFLAQEEALGNREVVVKCCFSGKEEAFILGSLSHPNIVPIHSVVHDDDTGLTAICMPFVGRVTLAELMDRLQSKEQIAVAGDAIRLDLNDEACVVGLVERVARGLAAAHERDVVHGDIKPSNILISFVGEPMLVDFNLSSGPQHNTRLGGTPPYMAPEQLRYMFGDSKEEPTLTRASDVFSLGVVLLELLVGPVPVSVDPLQGLELPQPEDWRLLLRRPTVRGRKIDPEMQRILGKCLEFEPADRYPDVKALTGDLCALLDARKRLHRRRDSLAVLVAVGTGAACVLGAAARYRQKSEPSIPHESCLAKALRTGDSGDYLQAAHDLRRAYQREPNEILAAWIGYCFARGDSRDSAKRYLLLAVANGGDAVSWNNLGYCNAQLQSFDEAEGNFRKAINLNRNLQAAHHNLALLRLNEAMRNRFDVSDDVWTGFCEAIRIGPENARLHYHTSLAIAYARSRQQQVGLDFNEHATKALSSEPIALSMRQSRLFRNVALDHLLKQSRELSMPADSPLLVSPAATTSILSADE